MDDAALDRRSSKKREREGEKDEDKLPARELRYSMGINIE